MEGKMSNKFLKILGICVLIVLLPVFIAVTAVCLVEDTNEMNDAKLPTYIVDCGEHAESVKIKEKDGKWIFVSMPVRTGYKLTNIKVDGKTYAIKDGAVAKRQSLVFGLVITTHFGLELQELLKIIA